MKIAIPVWRQKDGSQIYLNTAYIDYVQGANLTPVLIVPENIDMCEECDGLLLPGGVDIDPIYYNEENVGSYTTNFEKDEFERRLLGAFIEEGKPVFGICRGFQLIAREFLLTHPKAEKFMTFFQHVNDHNGPAIYKVPRSQPIHFVNADSILWDNKTSEVIRYPVNSMHHQALVLFNIENVFKIIEKRVYIAGTTQYGLSDKMLKAKNCIVEALTLTIGKSRIVGVQWHPEEMKDYALLHGCFGSKHVINGRS